MMLKGWAAREVLTSLHPALALAQSLEHQYVRVPILAGLALNVQWQGRVAESLRGRRRRWTSRSQLVILIC
jgi:hypothetical protein